MQYAKNMKIICGFQTKSMQYVTSLLPLEFGNSKIYDYMTFLR